MLLDWEDVTGWVVIVLLVVALGLTVAGIFSVGVFSIGIFSIGIFSFGIYAAGFYAVRRHVRTTQESTETAEASGQKQRNRVD